MNNPDIDTLVIVKGYGDPNDDRWQDHEAGLFMETTGRKLVYPKRLEGFQPGETALTEVFREEMSDILSQRSVEARRAVVIAHSAGGLAWLNFIQQYPEFRDAILYLVAVPRDYHGHTEIKDLYAPLPTLSAEQKKKVRVVGSNNDDIISELPYPLAASLDVQFDVVHNAGHFMPRSMHGDPVTLDLGKDWLRARNQFDFPYSVSI